MLFNAKHFSFESTINYRDIKEIIIDKSDKGLFSVDMKISHLYFLAESKMYLDNILSAFEIGRSLAKMEDLSLPSILIKRANILDSDTDEHEDEIVSFSFKFNKLNKSQAQYAHVLGTLAEAGYTPQDVWNGAVNLLEVVKQFQLLKEGI